MWSCVLFQDLRSSIKNSQQCTLYTDHEARSGRVEAPSGCVVLGDRFLCIATAQGLTGWDIFCALKDEVLWVRMNLLPSSTYIAQLGKWNPPEPRILPFLPGNWAPLQSYETTVTCMVLLWLKHCYAVMTLSIEHLSCLDNGRKIWKESDLWSWECKWQLFFWEPKVGSKIL